MTSRTAVLIGAVIGLCAVLFWGARPNDERSGVPPISPEHAAAEYNSLTVDATSSHPEGRVSNSNDVSEETGIEIQASLPGEQGPQLLSEVPAVFPPEALAQNLTDGSVVLVFTVAEDGTVKDIVVRESDGAVFEDAAIEAVSEYLYEPAFENGVPVETTGVSTFVAFNVAGPRTTPQINSRDSSGRLTRIIGREPDTADGTPLQADDDGAQIALTRFPPRFPESATEAGIESGYVVLSFTVTADGETANISVVESSSELFETPAIEAVGRNIYMPRMENGLPVARDDVRLRMDFSAPQNIRLTAAMGR